VDKWESIAERKIREAMEAGAFDNLPCKGTLTRDLFSAWTIGWLFGRGLLLR
jgi:DnaJ-like protein